MKITNLAILFNPRWELALGVDTQNRYVLTARHPLKGVRVIDNGLLVDNLWKGVGPLPVRTTLGAVPTALVSETLGDEIPEEWVDRSEERLRPSGLTAEQIVTEWGADNLGTMFAATLRKDAFEKALARMRGSRYVVSSLSVPLAALAALYKELAGTPYVLWQSGPAGSVLGFVRDGVLTRIVNWWAGTSDCAEAPQELASELRELINSLGGAKVSTVLVAPGGSEVPAGFEIENARLISPPQIDTIEPAYHEAYALASLAKLPLDFAPMEDRTQASLLARARKQALAVGNTAVAVAAALVVAATLLAGAIQVGERVVEHKLEPVQDRISALRDARTQSNSRKEQLLRTNQFLGRESVVTRLLSDFQIVFPQGVFAQQVNVSELDQQTWGVEILAVAYSTSLVSDLLSALGQVNGVSDVRMLYSEQAPAGAHGANRAVRLKVQCTWTPKREQAWQN